MSEHHITVSRTARFNMLGTPGPAIRELWIALHGYGQLSSYFIRHFRPLDDGTRLIVAPEALSRFYLAEGESGSQRVGATWMTREDRESEIGDYLGYLNQVVAHVQGQLDAPVPITVFGFSQGAITASRLVTLGQLPAQRYIIWGGTIAHDLDLDEWGPVLNQMDLHLIVGDDDYWITDEKREKEVARMKQHKIDFQFQLYEGEHRIDPEVFKTFIANLPPLSLG